MLCCRPLWPREGNRFWWSARWPAADARLTRSPVVILDLLPCGDDKSKITIAYGAVNGRDSFLVRTFSSSCGSSTLTLR